MKERSSKSVSSENIKDWDSKHNSYITVGFSDADYIVSGSADNVQIQAAIDAVITAGGGTVFIKAGTYDIQQRVWILGSDVIVRGDGQATKFLLADGADQEIFLVGNGFANDVVVDSGPIIPCNNVHFYDFFMDGNKENQYQGNFTDVRYGVSATRNLIRYRSDAQTSYGGIVDNVHAINGIQNGISSESHAFVTIRNCISESNSQFGIWCENGSNMSVTGNYTRENLFGGLKFLSASGKVIGNESKGDFSSGFIFQGFMGVVSDNIAYRSGWGRSPAAATGIYVSVGSKSCTITSNVIYGSYGNGMVLNGVEHSTIANNTFRRCGQFADDTYSDIYMTFAGGGSPCNNNVISGNTFNNETASYYSNAAKYNISSDSPTAHSGNTFIGNKLDRPVTDKIFQITEGNSFIDMEGVNPVGSHNYGYFKPEQTIDPKDGFLLIGTGYNSLCTVTIADGSFVGQEFTFIYHQDFGNKQLAWSTNVKWSGDIPPVFSGTTNTRDIMKFIWDGVNWNGSF